MPPHRKKNLPQRQWRSMDLHLHTPASVDYKQSNVTYLDFLKKAEERNLDIIAFADHNSVNGYARYLEEVESLELLERLGRLREDERERLTEYRRLRDKILILPGFEFTATLGFHILGIFPPDTTVREMEHLLLMLRVPPDKLDQGSGEVGATTDALTAYRMINEAGGMAIAAHANSSHGVAMPGFDFGGQTRIAYTQDPNLLALEVTDLESKSRRRTAAFFSGTKPEYPRRMHTIQSSDAHKLVFDPRYKNEMGVGDRATEIYLDELSFDAIKQVFLGNDFSRTRPYRPPAEEPYDPIRDAREQGDTLVQSFHERLHEKRSIARSILQDVVALANTNGGTIYIGASPNVKASVVGVDRPEQAGAELRSAISKEIAPPLEVQVDVVKSQGKNLLQVIVPRGSEAPYALEGSYIYVRSENETGLAHRDEIVQLVRDALAVEFAALSAIPATEKTPIAEETVQGQPAPEITAPGVALPVEPPRTGVEIVSSDVRKGVTYYSVRDLRNNRIVQNVTRASARRLWQYAIEEQEKRTCDPSKIPWMGSIGICKSHKRGGKLRYDFAQRVDGQIFVYYGVTDDGIHGAWRKLVEAETGGEPEEAMERETHTDVGALPEIAAEYQSEVIPEGSLSTEPSFDESEPRTEPSLSETAGLESSEEPAAHYPSMEEQTSSPWRSGENALAAEPSIGKDEAEEATPPLEEMDTLPGSGPGETGQSSEEPTSPPELFTDQTEHAPEPWRAEPLPALQPPHALQEVHPEPPQLPVPKSRAQEWREILDRAIAEARAAQQAAKGHPGSGAVSASEVPAPETPIPGSEGHNAAPDDTRSAGDSEVSPAESVEREDQVDDTGWNGEGERPSKADRSSDADHSSSAP